jgi:hypothetical protein
MILVNILLGVLFVASNYAIWEEVNAQDYASPNWGPIWINYMPRYYSNGELIPASGIIMLRNYPFMIYWVAMITNILFGIILLRRTD